VVKDLAAPLLLDQCKHMKGICKLLSHGPKKIVKKSKIKKSKKRRRMRSRKIRLAADLPRLDIPIPSLRISPVSCQAIVAQGRCQLLI
jgi:hypothetical protein